VPSHERAHVAHRDFYVLLLPAFNRAVFWFSPLAWWQLVRMAERAEIISDDTVLEKLDDRPSYAGILIDLASGRQEALVGSFALRVESRLRSSQSIQVLRRVDWNLHILQYLFRSQHRPMMSHTC
jgi:beta-lactamase regulating signal transducer with metallopeptidase domain